jgi:hypothetical protein
MKQDKMIPLPPGGVRGGNPYKAETVLAYLAVSLPQPLPEGGKSGWRLWESFFNLNFRFSLCRFCFFHNQPVGKAHIQCFDVAIHDALVANQLG